MESCDQCGERVQRARRMVVTLDGAVELDRALCLHCAAVVQVRLMSRARGVPG